MTDAAERFELPEFTRSLRGFASLGALGEPSHELVFGPLLAARRSAARVSTPEGHLAAFDVDRLRRGLMDAIARLADGRAGGDESLRRAFEARFEERAAPAIAALDAMAVRVAALKKAAVPERMAQWTGWCGAVQRLFDAVDAFWLSIDHVSPPRRGGWRGARSAILIAAAVASHAASAHAQRVTVRVATSRPDSLLAAGFDVVGAETGTTLVVVTPPERARLGALGYRVSGEIIPRAQTRAGAQVAPVVFRSFDDSVRGVRKWVDSIVAANPRVSVDTIGMSFEQRPLLVLKVGPAGDSPARPNAFFVATYHAREWAATETAIRLVQWLAEPPGGDARRDSLVQARDIWIMPVANPDGYQFTFDGDRLWRKTRSLQPGTDVGVDMNRNHVLHWGFDNQGSSPVPGSDIYRGPTPASEVETRGIEAFHALHPPVVALSYHTYAGLLMYPPGHVYGELASDHAVYRTLAGTHLRSAVTDRLPGSIRTTYAPGPSWNLYTTNGEYTDYAASTFGTLALTAELSSGYGTAGFYGFEFPDDETQLRQLFDDNLPFALDLLDAARDPATFVNARTGTSSSVIELESVAPEIRVTVPTAAAPTAAFTLSTPTTFRIDSTAGGRYRLRLVTAPVGRPTAFTISVGGAKASFRTLAVSGAESSDAPWSPQGFARDSGFARAGAWSWLGTLATLTSPPITVPADADTVSLVYWNSHFGNGFSPNPSGKIELSSDNGQTWTTISVTRGSAPAWVTDGVTVGGVRGKALTFRFSAQGMPWRLDEIAVVAHGPVSGGPVAAATSVRPSENPVRAASVRFAWPFDTDAGDLIVYDFSGREVWRRSVTAGETQTWDVAALGVSNGVYIVVARAGPKMSRLKLFVARRAP